MTLLEYLPALCDAMHHGELYSAKTVPFVYGPPRPITVQEYIAKKTVSFTLKDLCYMKNMQHMVQAQQSQYILAQADAMALPLRRCMLSSLLNLHIQLLF